MALADAYLETGLVFSPAIKLDPYDDSESGPAWSVGFKNRSAITVWWTVMVEAKLVVPGAVVLPEWFWQCIGAAIIFDGREASWVNTPAELPSWLP